MSFFGSIGLIDTHGAVRMKNQAAFSNLGYSYREGSIYLVGDQALAHVRARYPFANDDFQRVRIQWAYLQGVIGQLLARGTLLNPSRLQSTVSAISCHLLVDEGLDSDYLGGIALRLRDLRGRNLVSFTIATPGTGAEGDQSVVYVDDDGWNSLGHHLRNDTKGFLGRCYVTTCR